MAARSPPLTYRRERSAETYVPVAASLRTVSGNRVYGRFRSRAGEASATGRQRPRLLIAPKVTGGDSGEVAAGRATRKCGPQSGAPASD
ncbi:hypothetical protein CDAR_222071 [Caerostris darwini]|uniref:Uncharacterized protein n=1 Tax=Caerostris darwini TaxID=1538125 RepID=A0AAV4V0F4_9ARAC|nr:hypothetical protein CDAR_222071 [Caerostris darwini]